MILCIVTQSSWAFNSLGSNRGNIMAGKNLRYGVLLLALLCMAYRTNAEVLGMDCNTDSTVCTVNNSECGSDKTCVCVTNYEAKDDVCLMAAGQKCTTEAECASNKCEGDPENKKCAEGNSAQTVVVSACTITLSLLLLAFQRLF